MFCKNCGKEISAEASFCKNCGHSKTGVLPKKEEKNQGQNWFLENFVLSKNFGFYFLKGFLSGVLMLLFFFLSKDAAGKVLQKGDSEWIPFIVLVAYWVIITIGYFAQIKILKRLKNEGNGKEEAGSQIIRFLVEFVFAALLACLMALISYLISNYNPNLKFANIFATLILAGFIIAMVKKTFRISFIMLIVLASGIWLNTLPSGVNGNPNLSTTAKSMSCEETNTIKQTKLATHTVNLYDRMGNFIGHGSGIAIKDSATQGLVLTNYHNIEGAASIKVWDGFSNRGMVDASVWSAYPDQDIAIVKVDVPFPYTLDLNDSNQIQDAETVYAIGWPNDPSGEATITKGILSRRIKEDGFEILQTDASINPGNSGGPLISKCGIIGMNTAKMSWSDYETPAEGTGYALSSNFIISVIYPKK